MCTHFEHRWRAGAFVAPERIAEAGVEEAGVVVAQLADADVDREHLRGHRGGDADAFLAREDREGFRLQEAGGTGDPLERTQRLPEVLPGVGPFAGEHEHVLGGGGAPAARRAPFESDTEGDGALGVEREPVEGERSFVPVREWGLRVQSGDGLGIERGSPAFEAELGEPIPAPNTDGKREGSDLDPERAAVSGGGDVEARMSRRQDAREEVAPSGGTARIETTGEVRGEGQGLGELDEVAVAAFQHRPFPLEGQALGGEAAEAFFDRLGSGQEPGPHAVGRRAEPQVDAGGLDLGHGRGIRTGSGLDRYAEEGAQLVVDEDAGREVHGPGSVAGGRAGTRAFQHGSVPASWSVSWAVARLFRLPSRFHPTVGLPPAETTPMKIHEYQAKELLARFGVRVPNGRACTTPEEAAAAHTALGTPVTVVKAQIHAGGRGKGGGVKVVKSSEEAREAAEAILGMQLVTHQTGPEGQLVRTVWVEEGSNIDSELYVGIAIDRECQLPVFMASSEGGMEIEKVAAETPEKILKASFSPEAGLDAEDAKRLAAGIGLEGALQDKAVEFMQALAKAFCELDCSLAEINPLVTTKEGEVIALDAKINFDSNALFRHPDIVELRDLHEEDEKEIEASKYGLSYIALDGEIGCMVNGAGLAMATMDVIKLHGAEPANFLDVGGGATRETVTAAFKIVLSDPKVKGVLVNIFGGIMHCDVIAEGVCAAVKDVNLEVPLVVRLEGTNVEKGKSILENSGLPLVAASDLDDAAEKIAKAIGGKS